MGSVCEIIESYTCRICFNFKERYHNSIAQPVWPRLYVGPPTCHLPTCTAPHVQSHQTTPLPDTHMALETVTCAAAASGILLPTLSTQHATNRGLHGRCAGERPSVRMGHGLSGGEGLRERSTRFSAKPSVRATHSRTAHGASCRPA